jgi:hypothetical protein
MSYLTIGTILEFISNFLKIDNNQNLTSNESNVAYGGNFYNFLNYTKFKILNLRWHGWW